MNNQQIINQRWKKAENLFRSKLPEIRALYDEIGDDAIDTINSLGITHENLNKIVPENTRRQVKRKIESWKEEGIVTGYFAFMIASLTRYTYAKVFEILLYGYYFSKAKRINSISNYIFRETVQDCYDQGNRDLKQETKKLKWAVILPLLMISDYNMSYENYLIALSQTSAQETYRRIIELLKMKAKIVLSDLKQLLLKQVNRILNVNKGKYSGAIVDVSRQAGNKGYIMPAEEKDQLVMFIAEIDDRTTKMCRSLDGQIFHTKAWNRFTRYSDFYKGLHTFSWFGLEQGLNLPPINDHFHWCRSVVTYDIFDYATEMKMFRTLMSHVSDENRAITLEKLRDTFRRINAIKAKNGFKKDFKIDDSLEKDGVIYYFDGRRIVFDPSDEEILYAFKFQNDFGKDVTLRPRMRGEGARRTSDFLFDYKEFDLKTISGSGDKTISKRIRSSRGQTDNFVIKLNEGSRTVEEAIKDIKKTKMNNSWVNEVYLFDENDHYIKLFK